MTDSISDNTSKTYDTIAFTLKIVCTIMVFLLLLKGLMIFSINLYNKKVFQRNKVCYIHSYNMLTAKMNTKFISSQFFP